ncbi:hypothetical protein ANCCEY_06634 [Ancylostoma ceylanicum]|uniref:SCP domain-containing protein n=1 Tax=Ancylostoma ceylanicum TaxID=53326 RepID=A0A0D6LQI6_9BILA|nr:hypothetical protein ANCCEY_06634 [Ancylostoma ceylanicum]
MAEKAAQGCPDVPTQPTLPGYGHPGDAHASKIVKADEDYTTIAEDLIKQLWKDSTSKQINNRTQINNLAFAQVILLRIIGSSARGYNIVYETGNSFADLCSQCQKECKDALCRYPLSPLADKTSSDVCKGCSKDLKDDFRLTALHMHNYYRRLLASGWAKDKQIKYAKPAKTMNQLAMKEWWGPLESTGLGDNLEYTAEMQGGTLKYVPNIIHDKSTQIGCAAKTCTKQGITLIDCRYNTTVGVGDTIYEVGETPCNPCPAGTACSKLGGVCGAPSTA